MPKNINICFITDENYALPTSVAIQSLIENRAKKTRYNIYIMAKELCDESIARFKKLQTYKCKIIVIKTQNIYDNIDAKHPFVSKAALLKFNLPNMLPELDKVLYIDGDVLILDDLSQLFNTNLNGKYAAVVADIFDVIDGHNTRLDLSNYFNSGVMLLNLKKMRDDKISDKLIDYKIKQDTGHFMDQDAFNSVFNECIECLPLKYNMLLVYKDIEYNRLAEFYNMSLQELNQTINKPVILHMAGHKTKPWNSDNAVGNDLWQKYYESMKKRLNRSKRFRQFLFRYKTYSNGRHKILLFGIRVFSYKPRFAPGAKIKGNFLFTKEKCPNGRRHIYICGIKIASYIKHEKTKTETSIPINVHDLVDDYKNVFERNGYNVIRENGKIKIWNKNIIIEGDADNTLWTAASVFCNDEYHFDMDEKYVMFDIGFNLGMTSLHKAQDKNCVKIYAFEPFTPTFKLAQHNMVLNKKLSKKITAFNYGLGNKDEVIDINYNPDRPGAMSSVKNIFSECEDIEKIHIKKTSKILKPLFAKHKEKIFLKIDCEGAEKQILPDLDASGLIKQVDVIVMEWHFEDPKWIIDLLTRNGFIVFRLNVVTNEIGMLRAYRK